MESPITHSERSLAGMGTWSKISYSDSLIPRYLGIYQKISRKLKKKKSRNKSSDITIFLDISKLVSRYLNISAICTEICKDIS